MFTGFLRLRNARVESFFFPARGRRERATDSPRRRIQIEHRSLRRTTLLARGFVQAANQGKGRVRRRAFSRARERCWHSYLSRYDSDSFAPAYLPHHHPRVCSRSFSSIWRMSRPFIASPNSSDASSTTFGSL